MAWLSLVQVLGVKAFVETTVDRDVRNGIQNLIMVRQQSVLQVTLFYPTGQMIRYFCDYWAIGNSERILCTPGTRGDILLNAHASFFSCFHCIEFLAEFTWLNRNNVGTWNWHNFCSFVFRAVLERIFNRLKCARTKRLHSNLLFGIDYSNNYTTILEIENIFRNVGLYSVM